MAPQQFAPSQYYSTSSSTQYVNGYSSQSPQNADPGPSTSISLSSPFSSQQAPSEIHNSGSLTRQRVGTRSKRKRGSSVPDDNADNSPGAGSSIANNSQKTGPKKKKANRACFHCQKAHLTCDDSRPCQRCIKRGIGDKCMEGIRKKAKYLLDEEELAALKQQQQKAREKSTSTAETPPHQPSIPPLRPPDDPSDAPTISDQDPLFNLAFDPAYTFGSEAANLEYSILSAILGNPSPPEDSSRMQGSSESHSQTAPINGSSYPQFANPEWPAPPPHPPAPPKAASPATTFLHQHAVGQGSASQTSTPPYRPSLTPGQVYSNTTSGTYQSSPPSTIGQGPSGVSHSLQQSQIQYGQSWSEVSSTGPSVDGLTSSDPSYMRPALPLQPQNMTYHVDSRGQAGTTQTQPLPPLSPPPSNSSPGTPLAGGNSLPFQQQGNFSQSMPDNSQKMERNPSTQLYQTAHWGFTSAPPPRSSSAIGNGYTVMSESEDRSPSSVYKVVIKPYDYTQGYHDLMRYLHERFDNKNDILRVVRALAIIRPSLIALQMPLTEEDEIFVEKSFQRSLIEMDKLISFGGTPTVVWRRTGEICLVGFEFTMLTGWTREELIGKGKYIYELFENQSTVEYYEKFAAHAFENTTQSVISHCVLLKPSGAPVPCTFCFSIKRDIFDLPNMIIGQWLPLL